MPSAIPEVVSQIGIKSRPRYRARILRNLILELTDRPSGESLTEIADEFWARHDYRPNHGQLATQVIILQRDDLIKRVGFGVYKRISGAEYRRTRRPAPKIAPAAPSQPRPSIFD